MRKILDVYYDRFLAITRNPLFIKDVNTLRARFGKWGVNIPDEGFRSEKELQMAFDVLNANFHDYMAKIGGVYSTELLQSQQIPPINIRYFLKRILEKYGFNPIDDVNYQMIRQYVFFKDYGARPTHQIWRRENAKTGEHELWIRIFPYTSEGDLTHDFWKHKIIPEQMKMDNVRLRGKEKKTYNTQLSIYLEFRKALLICSGDIDRAIEVCRDLNCEQPSPFAEKIYELNPEYSPEYIRKIILDLHEFLIDLNLLPEEVDKR